MINAVEQRGIKYLVHFTRIENLTSIFNNGLIPINNLERNVKNFFYNDELRLDNCRDANCLSIQFPNYKMFYKYRCEEPNSHWVVLGIKKSILWEKDCAFCVENAAGKRVTSIPLIERKGVAAFNRLYNDYPGRPSREELGLEAELPTHPQAEVLTFGIIEPKYVWGVAFKNLYEKNKYLHMIPSNIKVEVVPKLFGYRDDYEHWR